MNTRYLFSVACCCVFFTHSLLVSLTASAQEQEDTTLVQVEQVRLEPISQQIVVPGTVISESDSQLASEVDGRIVWMATVGTNVKQGDVLVKLDDKRLQLTLRQNKANMARWQSSVMLLKKRQQRLLSMAALNNVSKDNLDEITSQLEVAQQEFTQAELAVELTAYQIEQSQLTAPFDALVVEQLQSIGEYTRLGMPLVRVVNPNNIEASVRAPLTAIPFIQTGMTVEVADRQRTLSENIKGIIPIGNGTSRMMEVRVGLNASDFAIGSAVRVTLPNSDTRQGITVPRDALVLRQSGLFVYQIDDKMQAQQVPVTTGIGMGDRIEVFGELKQNEGVVVRGAEYLRQGQVVRFASDADNKFAKI